MEFKSGEKNFLKVLKIGRLTLNHPLILAPMSGISDLPFRLLNRKFGAELAFVEMLNVRSLGYKSAKTKQMLCTSSIDRPLGVQILGAEREYILRALDILKDYSYDILDFNAACPVKKVTRRGEGASLLKEPDKLNKILRLIVRNVSVSVTVKIRTGWDETSQNSKEIAVSAQDAGVSALFIHGRTRRQGYKGTVDYSAIAEVKGALKIPVIASGDILTPTLAQKMFEETGCDGIMIARGALGHPWIFNEIIEFLENGTFPKRRDRQEIAEVMREHLDSCIEFYGPKTAVKIFHKFFSWYVRGINKTRRLKEKAYRSKTPEDMLSVITEFSRCNN